MMFKKFFSVMLLAIVLIFGIVAGQILSAEAAAKSNVTWYMEYKCLYCNKVINYEGLDENYQPQDHSHGVCNSPEGKAAAQKFGNNTNYPISFR